MKKKLIGLRSFKTILVVVLSHIISYYVPELDGAVISAAAVTAMDISIYGSLTSSGKRISTNIFAILVAFFLQALNLVNPIGVAIGATTIVLICNLLNVQHFIGSTMIFFGFVLSVPFSNQNLEAYAFNRIVDTLAGSAIGVIVNAYVFRPRQEKFLLESYRKSYIKLRNGLKDLIEEDKSVDEIGLLDDISQINDNSRKLKQDIKLKMNEKINTVTVSKLNNLFRTALSLIIELNELDESPVISEKNIDVLNEYFKGDFTNGFETGIPATDFDIRYNYELKKLVDTLESIEYNLQEYTQMYGRSKQQWYKDKK